MGVQRLFGGDVPELDPGINVDILDGVNVPVDVWVANVGTIDNAPVVIRVAMRIQGNLLFYAEISLINRCTLQESLTLATTGVIVWMRVKISTLCIDVTNCDLGTNSNV